MNENKNSRAAAGGTGFIGLLTIAFIVLKLTHVVEWEWKWVLSPLWISAAVGVGAVIVVIIIGAIMTAVQERREKKDK